VAPVALVAPVWPVGPVTPFPNSANRGTSHNKISVFLWEMNLSSNFSILVLIHSMRYISSNFSLEFFVQIGLIQLNHGYRILALFSSPLKESKITFNSKKSSKMVFISSYLSTNFSFILSFSYSTSRVEGNLSTFR
jgi:hypothetical protein